MGNRNLHRAKQIEEALRESEERFRVMFESSHDLLTVADENGKTILANPAWCEALGHTPEMQGDPIEKIHPDDRTRVIEAWGEGEFTNMEYRYRTASGDYISLQTTMRKALVAGKPTMYVVAHDITERKRAEEALHLERDNLINILEAMEDGGYIVNQQYDIQYVNAVLVNDFGPYEGRKCYAYFHDREDVCPWCKNQDVFAGKTVQWEWYSSKNQRTYDLIDTPLKNPDGSISKLEIFRDITERVRAEEKIKEYSENLQGLVEERTAELSERVAEIEGLNRAMTNLLEDLQAANRNLEETAGKLEAANEELEAFAYSVSHDLRAPLRHIDGFLQRLLKREEERLDPTSSRYLNIIAASSAKMGRLIDDLLALSRTGQVEINLRRVAPNEIVEQVRQELEPMTEGRLITWEIAPLPAVRADAGLLRVVWINLLSNAVKYTAPRPQACIEIGATPPDDEGQVTFFIRDDGVGFDSLYAHKLFGAFQRLHREDEFEGSGIGLATVRRIIHRHGGRVWAEGEVDRGATFYFTLREAEGE